MSENWGCKGQPDWAFVANLGDVNPVEHGGCFVFEDATGVYPPEMEIWHSNHDYEDEDTPNEWTVYRFSLERCTYIDGVLSDTPFHPEESAWWAGVGIAAIVSCYGADVDEVIAGFCSDDPLARARAYRDVVQYYEIACFDHYPLTFTEEEIRERASEYRHMERCARVGLSPDAPEGIVRDRMLDLGLIRE